MVLLGMHILTPTNPVQAHTHTPVHTHIRTHTYTYTHIHTWVLAALTSFTSRVVVLFTCSGPAALRRGNKSLHTCVSL
jgi:hypothetical protein